MLTTALKLNQKTLHTIAQATDMSPAAVNDVYENYNLLNQEAYVVLGFTCVHGDEQEPLSVDEDTFQRDFMFVTEPSDTEFTEVLIIR